MNSKLMSLLISLFTFIVSASVSFFLQNQHQLLSNSIEFVTGVFKPLTGKNFGWFKFVGCLFLMTLVVASFIKTIMDALNFIGFRKNRKNTVESEEESEEDLDTRSNDINEEDEENIYQTQ